MSVAGLGIGDLRSVVMAEIINQPDQFVCKLFESLLFFHKDGAVDESLNDPFHVRASILKQDGPTESTARRLWLTLHRASSCTLGGIPRLSNNVATSDPPKPRLHGAWLVGLPKQMVAAAVEAIEEGAPAGRGGQRRREGGGPFLGAA